MEPSVPLVKFIKNPLYQEFRYIGGKLIIRYDNPFQTSIPNISRFEVPSNFIMYIGFHINQTARINGCTHSDPQHFETKEKLRNHIVQHDINSCDKSTPGNPTYKCPWKEHLRQHIKQRPFKVINILPVTLLYFGSPYALSQHLIINHSGSVADPDTDDDKIKFY
ncbi:hypothetical protein GLOIN_2v1870611 [Rhizophagus irregularis DAOM 181602=DAOM 197198]|nr:hypothetical protein GLOIN_2v1870611 [Rhizophagus irregularis DAOM 181602=DAOM 197198]